MRSKSESVWLANPQTDSPRHSAAPAKAASPSAWLANHVSSIAWLFYFLSLIPLLILAFYSFPAADDFRMGYRAHEVWLSSHSIAKTLASAVPIAWYYYNNWIGYYTSAAFSAIPPSTFSPLLYWISVWGILLLLTGAVLFFLHALLVRRCGMERKSASLISALTLFFLVHAMPEEARAEAFFWHSGAWNYTATFSLALLLIGLLLLLMERVPGQGRAKYALLLICSCALAFCVGGGNYLSAFSSCLVCGIWLFLGLLPAKALAALRLPKLRLPRVLYLPFALLLIGFAFNCAAPGNSIRMAAMSAFGGLGPLKSIGVSLYNTAAYCINRWTRIEHLLSLAFLAPVFWRSAPQLRSVSFRYPVPATVLTYGLVSANMTPPVYTSGTIDAGRMQAVIYAQYFLLLVLLEGYLIGWLRMHVFPAAAASDSSALCRRFPPAVAAAFFLLSVLLAGVHPAYYTGTQAVGELLNGSAAVWRDENKERLRLLTEDGISDPVLPRHTVSPALLSTQDIAEDPADWINEGIARFFHKNSVNLAAASQAAGGNGA